MNKPYQFKRKICIYFVLIIASFLLLCVHQLDHNHTENWLIERAPLNWPDTVWKDIYIYIDDQDENKSSADWTIVSQFEE